MEFIIKYGKIKNFKGLSKFEFELNEKTNSIYGDNETGKTTLFDSFVWCLFGKDSMGNSSFGITPNFLDKPKVTEVQYGCEVDKVPIHFARLYVPKYSKDKKFKGYKTECFLNGVQLSIQDFSDNVSEIIKEEIFKLLTNPLYFLEQMIPYKGETVYQRKRKILFELAGVSNDLNLVKKSKKYSSLLSKMEIYKDASALLKSLKREIFLKENEDANFLASIDQQSKNFEEVKEEKQELLDKKKKLEEELESTQFRLVFNSKEEELKKAKEEDIEIKSKIAYIRATIEEEKVCPYCGKLIQGADNQEKLEKIDMLIEKQKDNEKLINQITFNYQKEVSDKYKEALDNLHIVCDLLSKIQRNEECQKKIDDLIAKRKENLKYIESLKKDMFLVEDFLNSKIKSATKKINKLFETIEWELYRVNSEGNIEDICIPYVNGTHYKDLSASAKIFCGLEIVKVFQEKYKIRMPIFVDNRERITTQELPINNQCQIITLTASNDSCPKCGSVLTTRRQKNRLWKCLNCGEEFEKSIKFVNE